MEIISTQKKLREEFDLTPDQVDAVLAAVKVLIASRSWSKAFQLDKMTKALAHELNDYSFYASNEEAEARKRIEL